MRKLNTEFFIAQRIATRTGGDNGNVMVRIASLTVAIGMAVMIVSMAVISGFRSEITGKLLGFGASVQVVNLDGNTSYETSPIVKNRALERVAQNIAGFKSINPYAVKGAIVKSTDAMQGVMLKGVDSTFDWSFFSDNLVEGITPRVSDSVRSKDVMLSRSLASMMQVWVDDRIEMLFIQSDRPPRRDRFKVVGIFDSGFEEMDKLVVPTDMRNVQRLNGWDEHQITGYEIAVDKIGQMEPYRDALYMAIMTNDTLAQQNLMVTDTKEKFPNLFDWLKAHNVNAAVIITIMLLVALLNMISALLIILLQRTSMIGVLKALGMTNRALQKMFLIRSSFIIVKGLVWGNIVGIGLSLVQYYTHVVKLDNTGYFLSHVPIELGWWWIVALNVGTMVVILALLSVPAMIISYVKPDTTIRYQ